MLIIRWLAEVHDSLYGGGGSGGFTTPCRGVKWSVLGSTVTDLAVFL